MKLLEKLGILETNNNQENLSNIDISALKKDIETFAPINLIETDIDTSELVSTDDIYMAADLTNMSKSIFKVDEIKKVLPSSMTEETKKQSVIGMMQVSGITVEEVVNDANLRTDALLATLEESSCETSNIIADGEARIAQYQEEIKALKESIEQRKKLQEEQNKIINSELEKINSIKEFII